MSKLGDLWVRLGLKDDDYKKGIQRAQHETENFGAKLKKLAPLAAAAWTAVAAAVIKFAKDTVSMTQKWGDQWSIAMEGVKGAYGAFVRQLSSGEGWDNLFANMRNAAIAARQMAADLDELFERKLSSDYAIAQAEKEIAEWTNVMNDASKSDEERKKAADDIIAKEQEIANLKKSIAKQEADAIRGNIIAQTGLHEEEIDYLVKEYNKNRDIINQSREYLAERKRLQAEVKATQSGGIMGEEAASTTAAIEARHREAVNNLKALEDNTEAGIKAVAELTTKYDKSSDDMIEKFVAADVAVIQFETDAIRASSRASRMLGNLNKGDGGSSTNTELQAALAIQKAAEQSQKTERQIIEETYRANVALFEKLGLDTTALTAQYFDQIIAAIQKESAEMNKELVAVAEVEMPPIDMSHVDDEINEWVENFNKMIERAKDLAEEFRQAVAGGFSDGMQEMMDQLMSAENFNTGAVVAALLTPLADMAIKEGEIAIAAGLGIEAIKDALASLDPAVALAAGAALIAVGAAAKAGLAALARSGSASSYATTAGAGSIGGGTGEMVQKSELTVFVSGKIRGNDIVLSGQRTLNDWSR